MDDLDLTKVINTNQGGLQSGDQQVLKEVYARLREIARIQKFKIRDHGLQTTAIVNEAWLKTKSGKKSFEDRSHFFAYCALAMRHILIDQARRNKLVTYVSDEKELDGQPTYLQSDFLLDLEDHLVRLAEYSPRLEKIFTFRFYGEMQFEDIGSVLEISRRTVIRDWKKAQSMLAVSMGQNPV